MVTSLDDIKKLANGEEVKLSGWDEKPLVCRLKRVGMMYLVSQGSIPNGLMPAVMALFDGKKEQIAKITAKEMTDIIDLFCRATLIEPSYEEVAEYLTDVQRTEIFNYSQGGLKRLETFRKK